MPSTCFVCCVCSLYPTVPFPWVFHFSIFLCKNWVLEKNWKSLLLGASSPVQNQNKCPPLAIYVHISPRFASHDLIHPLPGARLGIEGGWVVASVSGPAQNVTSDLVTSGELSWRSKSTSQNPPVHPSWWMGAAGQNHRAAVEGGSRFGAPVGCR